jgi:ABC-type transporter MlaC component
MISRMVCRFSAWFLAGLLYTTAAWSESPDPASVEFINRTNATIAKAVAASGDASVAARRVCDDLASTSLDLEAMMKIAAGKAWDRFDSVQREAYGAAFKKRIIRDCTAHAGGYLRSTVQLVGVRQLSSGDKLIGTRSEGSPDAKVLMWQVHPKEKGRLMVTDLLVDGRSAMLTLREEAGVAIERNDGDVAAAIGAINR